MKPLDCSVVRRNVHFIGSDLLLVFVSKKNVRAETVLLVSYTHRGCIALAQKQERTWLHFWREHFFRLSVFWAIVDKVTNSSPSNVCRFTRSSFERVSFVSDKPRNKSRNCRLLRTLNYFAKK